MIVSKETDVFLLCLAVLELLLAEIIMKNGTQNCAKCIDIPKHVNAISRDMYRALLGMHAFNGCGTESAFMARKRQML